ncbi:hypothetical protein DS745_12615 [Anaerobacillus alkaliphilus]|uniref:Uncharacterized protein n=1 Tax=Anaerobacillus alkaliphilus TaxID=1548597 RepID=A0A4Q0VSS2_9BACI|nr:hypothetical protein [Anaerobacillus alkaliphilus]RXJ00367.1 hypothetical protein DS745_12615 [Anaerobacillus alkaliphilus]
MKRLFPLVLGTILTIGLIGCNEKEAVNESAIGEDTHADDHSHDELPFEWAGSYELVAGTYSLEFKQNEFGDETMLLTFIKEDSNIKDLEHHAAHIMDTGGELFHEGDYFAAESEYAYNLSLNVKGSTSYTFTIQEAGTYRIFTEHHADEFEMEITNENSDVIIAKSVQEYEGHDHEHGH